MLPSHWLDEHFARKPTTHRPELEGEVRADVAIVGGGFVGLWTALRLKELEPSLDVVLIERAFCGAGASGRNTGLALPYWVKFLSLAKLCGEAEALRLCRASAEAVETIGRFCEKHGIDAHYQRDGWLWTATCKAHEQAWRPTIDALERHQVAPFRALAPDEVRALSRSPVYLAGVLDRACATVQPAELVRGLFTVACQQGVRIFENSPLLDLKAATSPEIVTPKGRLRAHRVVLAMNAWAAMFPELFKSFVIISAEHIATRPVPDELERLGLKSTLAISDSRLLLRAHRRTHDGRLVYCMGGVSGVHAYGGRIGTRFDGPSRRQAILKEALAETYPALASAPIAQSWCGPVDRTKSGLPFFGHLWGREDISFGAGFSGNGVAPSLVAGKILASLALGRKDEWSGCGLVRPLARDFPPEPIRFIGTPIIRWAAVRKDKAEHAGKSVGRLTQALVSLAPSGFMAARR